MLVDEGDRSPTELAVGRVANIALTIRVGTLKYKRNDYVHSQGNYDYQAHAHV